MLLRRLVLLGLAAALIPAVEAPGQAAWTTEWMPAKRLIPDLRADPLEPRISLEKSIGTSAIDARIGGTWDFLHLQPRRPVLGFERFGFGAGAMADLALDVRFMHRKSALQFPFLLRRHTRFDLISGDYSFAMHATGVQPFGGLEIRHRVQLVHLSAHLGDSRFETASDAWMDGQPPVHFSRNYWQWLIDAGAGDAVRVYLQHTLLTFHSRIPERPSGWSSNAGMEVERPVSRQLKGFAAIDIRVFELGFRRTRPVGIAARAGIDWQTATGRGASVFVSSYTGPDWRGQFYRKQTERLQAGLMLYLH